MTRDIKLSRFTLVLSSALLALKFICYYWWCVCTIQISTISCQHWGCGLQDLMWLAHSDLILYSIIIGRWSQVVKVSSCLLLHASESSVTSGNSADITAHLNPRIISVSAFYGSRERHFCSRCAFTFRV